MQLSGRLDQSQGDWRRRLCLRVRASCHTALLGNGSGALRRDVCRQVGTAGWQQAALATKAGPSHNNQRQADRVPRESDSHLLEVRVPRIEREARQSEKGLPKED